ncbi:hypothetical protein [Streptomyces sp. NPDC006971]|uniref:hypothetical protein n=1 Tax=Streptomyces sp. NPDC006971 TaxID=3154784 RepID=UPI0033C22E6B
MAWRSPSTTSTCATWSRGSGAASAGTVAETASSGSPDEMLFVRGERTGGRGDPRMRPALHQRGNSHLRIRAALLSAD